MKQLIDFIDRNFSAFSEMDDSEVEHIELDHEEITDEMVNYLKLAPDNRFDYRGICVYYVDRENEIWVENMDN